MRYVGSPEWASLRGKKRTEALRVAVRAAMTEARKNDPVPPPRPAAVMVSRPPPRRRSERLAVRVEMWTDGRLWRATAYSRKGGHLEWREGPMLTSGVPPSEMAAEAVIAMVKAMQARPTPSRARVRAKARPGAGASGG